MPRRTERLAKIMPTIKISRTHKLSMTMDETKAKRNKSNAEQLRHMCEYCGYRTRISGNLLVHKRRHTGDKPFRCGQCEAAFPARYQLVAHKERHMDACQRRERYKCRDCGVGFLSARALYHHKPLHATKKQFECGLCGKSFAQAAGFAQHKRWHREQNERVTSIISTTAN